ncbi:MAG: alkyl hydroperoxide reductase subunit F [Muribaculaceae bacterium]
MLDQDILNQLKGIFAGLKSEITFRMIARDDSPQATDMKSFLEDVASTSPKLSVDTVQADVEAPGFEILKNGEASGISFCGIPNGHEFTTLLLAVLNADGQGKNLPDSILRGRIEALKGPIKLRTFVSLTCTNCPDVAQALNLVALLNPAVENEVIDGATVPELAESLNIQSVPTVYAGNQVLSVGRSTLGDLLDKLEAMYGTEESGEATPVDREYDMVVIGGGPAGATAAIYSARKGFRTAVVAKAVGGQVKETMGIENLTSVPETTGPKLASDIREHLSAYPIDVYENRSVDSVSFDGNKKSVICGKETFSALALIIASGAGWRKLSVPGEEEHIGKGVAFCTHCDGPFYAGKKVAVIGGGNSGIEAALDLAGICPSVDVFEFLDTLKADGVLQEKAKAADNINIHTSTQVVEVLGDPGKVSGLKVKDRVTGEESIYPVEGVFVQIGLTANNAPFKDHLPMTKAGEIIVDERCRTSVKGVYAAGDVTNVPYKQIVIAMGEGAKAALSAFEDSMRGELS